MPEDPRREGTDEVGGDGRVGEIALLDAVHHAHVGAQESGHAHTDGGKHADLLGADDAATATSRFSSDEATRSIWSRFVKTADSYDQPGTFSAMIGFEWSCTPGGNNLHRVVVFADGADKVGQVLPFTTFASQEPEDLWQYLADYESKTGGRSAIPALHPIRCARP